MKLVSIFVGQIYFKKEKVCSTNLLIYCNIYSCSRNSSVFSRRIPVTSTGDIKQEVPSEISTKNVGGRDIKQEKDEEEEGELSIPEIGMVI